MGIYKLGILIAAFTLVLFLGAGPVTAQVCDPADTAADCDGDGIPNGEDTCDNLDPLLDCDNDGVPNGDDECPDTVAGAGLVIGTVTCTVSGLDTVLANGCSLSQEVASLVEDCADGAKNHGKFVSCVTKRTNALKKAKDISGKQKGQIQSCAAGSNIGRP